MSKMIDMTGHIFNGCEVIEKENYKIHDRVAWLCVCYCGNYFVAAGKSIRNGEIKSCGCLRKEILNSQGKKNKTHGETNNKLYNVWRGIKKRCRIENTSNYKHYGGRGIQVCDEWYDSYENFKDWATNSGYKEGLSIDRIDVNGNYEPSNCRWVTMKTQQNNRRNTKYGEYKGRTMTFSEIAEITGLTLQAIHYRYKHNIDFDKPKKETPEEELKSNKEIPEGKKSEDLETPEDSLQSKNKETRNPNKYMD